MNEEKKTPHTPTPWQQKGLTVEVPGRGIIAKCYAPHDGGVFECSANAAFIVEACNTHAALTTENSELKGKVEMLVKELKEIHKYLGSHDCTEGTEFHYMKKITDLLTAFGIKL